MENLRELIRAGMDSGKFIFTAERDSDGEFTGCYIGKRRFNWYMMPIEKMTQIIMDDEGMDAIIEDIADKMEILSAEDFNYCMEVLKA